MNRIVLIGNGFDLAHGLPTSYKDFIDWYWCSWVEKLASVEGNHCQDEFVSFDTIHPNGVWQLHIESFRAEDPNSEQNIIAKIKQQAKAKINYKITYLSRFFEKLNTNLKDVPNVNYEEGFFYPDRIMLLNFNYTSVADIYLNTSGSFLINHIHGDLSNGTSVIFGYGDELDDGYADLARCNDNELLRNIKSIRYQESGKYRQLLQFIDSSPFQIYIMGHSCGNSDRTLLNTLFEHKNCVSIKPFFYKKEDGSDNYLEIVQNISRNFTDMKKMRDRVVNKTFCEPLPQIK